MDRIDLTDLFQHEDAWLWEEIKKIIMATGRFDMKDWQIERTPLETEIVGDERCLRWNIRLVPARKTWAKEEAENYLAAYREEKGL